MSQPVVQTLNHIDKLLDSLKHGFNW